MILLLQVLLGAAVAAWHQFGGLPALVAIPLAAYGAAFIGLWRKPGKRSDQRPPFRNPGLPFNENPPATSSMRPTVPPKAPPPIIRGTPPYHPGWCRPCCRDHLAELELAERFNSESG